MRMWEPRIGSNADRVLFAGLLLCLASLVVAGHLVGIGPLARGFGGGGTISVETIGLIVGGLAVLLLFSSVAIQAPSPPRPAAPVRTAAEFQRGVMHSPSSAVPERLRPPRASHEMLFLRRLGATWTAVTPVGRQWRATDETILGVPDDPSSDFLEGTVHLRSDSAFADEISAAHSFDLGVLVRPVLRVGGGGPAAIRQTSAEAHRRWWSSYRLFSLHYAALARSRGAEAFCVGTELDLLAIAHPEEWRALIAEIRAADAESKGRPPMLLTYAAGPVSFDRIEFWDALDWIGIQAFFPLAGGDDASAEEIAAAWAPHRARIEEAARRWNRPVLFTEAGFPPLAGAHRFPAAARLDLHAQARAFEGLFRAFADAPWWSGVYLRKGTEGAPGGAAEISFRGRPAEAVVRRWYDGTAGPLGGTRPSEKVRRIPLRIRLWGESLDDLRRLFPRLGIEEARVGGEIVVVCGGRDALLAAERALPEVRKALVTPATDLPCPNHVAETVLGRLARGELSSERLPKIEARAGDRRRAALTEFEIGPAAGAPSFRARVFVDGEPWLPEKGVRDVFVLLLSTPFGSPDRFSEITGGLIHAGVGLAVHDPTGKVDWAVFKETDVIRVEIAGGSATLRCEDDPHRWTLRRDETVEFATTGRATVLGLDALTCPVCAARRPSE